ncbi:MAG TPA: VOC family protein, partial [Edaphobacter sp.]|nr:VOC family protein [Edaphobacter sp.]
FVNAVNQRSKETYSLNSIPHIPGPSKPRARATINPTNPMTFPAPVPEIPAANVDKAAAYYVNMLGFTFDWGDDQGGIAGISRGNCRLFITNRSFRESYGNIGPILFWLNLDSKAEVDELFAQWEAAQAKIVSEPEDKPWKLREFIAANLDGNLIRVFYDFRADM